MKIIRKIGAVYIAVLGLMAAPVIVKAQGIEFLHNLDEALAKAKAENKMVFIDFYTSWCGPCKMLSNEVFPQAKVGSYFNSQFINCKIQCDDKGVGVELGKKYQINAYPTLMFIDKNGAIVHSTAGAPSADGLIELAKTAANPERNLASLIKEWDAGNRKEEFVAKYFTALKKAYRGEKASADFANYFNELSANDKAKKSTFELVKTVGAVPFSPVFEYLETNRNAYAQSVGATEIDKYIADTYLWHLKGLVGNEPRPEFKAAMEKFKAKNYPYYDEYAMFYSVYETFDSKGSVDVNEYMRRGTAFLAKYGKNNDAYTLALTGLLGNCTGKKDEGIAGIKWMEDLLERNRDPRYLNTYFYILWRNYNLDKALLIGNEIRDNEVKAGKPTKTIEGQIEMVKGLKAKQKI
ncbi:thioredoxin family protein [Solitalea lacus]|uniref:thioredoxin family protein n=1 Tax=Solitalea lacus TaxID=2911172 RepID=UPI001EDB685B|nr:thioredoxin domain-containing protein [Solitalea lacus]UKJ06794.1 thioredoxin domain-containing protein [Solitalea lacus]